MKSLKLFFILFMCYLTLGTSFAVQVVESAQEETPERVPFFVKVVFFVLVMGIIFIFIVSLLAFVIAKISQVISEHNTGKNDFLYATFTRERKKCHMNADSDFKKRNWKLFFLFFKRKPIFLKTKKGTKILGYYDGECDIKQNFYFLAVYNKAGLFKYTSRLMMIPKDLKDSLMDVVVIDKKKAIILYCEGADNFENVDYYLMPLIEDPMNKNRYIDFSKQYHEKYVENVVYQDIIKQNLLAYKKNVEDAVETNLDIHLKRRS